jgi:hypothetical protein
LTSSRNPRKRRSRRASERPLRADNPVRNEYAARLEALIRLPANPATGKSTLVLVEMPLGAASVNYGWGVELLKGDVGLPAYTPLSNSEYPSDRVVTNCVCCFRLLDSGSSEAVPGNSPRIDRLRCREALLCTVMCSTSPIIWSRQVDVMFI